MSSKLEEERSSVQSNNSIPLSIHVSPSWIRVYSGNKSESKWCASCLMGKGGKRRDLHLCHLLPVPQTAKCSGRGQWSPLGPSSPSATDCQVQWEIVVISTWAVFSQCRRLPSAVGEGSELAHSRTVILDTWSHCQARVVGGNIQSLCQLALN